MSAVHNYVLAGLSSAMIPRAKEGEPIVRVFSMTRHQVNQIAPHSHRFSLLSKVLKGFVINILWQKTVKEDPEADEFYRSTLSPINGGMGKYQRDYSFTIEYYKPVAKRYVAGEEYFMQSSDIHSIEFSKGAVIQIIENPQETEKSYLLEPAIEGKRIPLGETEDWMFNHDE